LRKNSASDGTAHKYVVDDAAKRQVNRFCIFNLIIAMYILIASVFREQRACLNRKELLKMEWQKIGMTIRRA